MHRNAETHFAWRHPAIMVPWLWRFQGRQSGTVRMRDRLSSPAIANDVTSTTLHSYRMGWSVAVWRPAAKHAEVVIKKSPYLDRMGGLQKLESTTPTPCWKLSNHAVHANERQRKA